jgi:hypothetical protein
LDVVRVDTTTTPTSSVAALLAVHAGTRHPNEERSHDTDQLTGTGITSTLLEAPATSGETTS